MPRVVRVTTVSERPWSSKRIVTYHGTPHVSSPICEFTRESQNHIQVSSTTQSTYSQEVETRDPQPESTGGPNNTCLNCQRSHRSAQCKSDRANGATSPSFVWLGHRLQPVPSLSRSSSCTYRRVTFQTIVHWKHTASRLTVRFGGRMNYSRTSS